MRAWSVGRNRSVIDDSAASRILRLHDADRLLRAEKRAREIYGDRGAPLLVREILHRNRRRTRACIVEQQVETSELLFHARKESFHGLGFADIGRDRQHLSAIRM